MKTFIMKLLKFLAGFFQDQRSNNEYAGSRKALALYILLFFDWYTVSHPEVFNLTVFWGNVILTAFCLGAITMEWFDKNFPGKI